MALVENIKLSLGKVHSELEFAEVSYDILFSEDEQTLNLRFTEGILLFERDSQLDMYYRNLVHNIGIAGYPIGTRDDFIGQVYGGFIRPNGNTSLHREHRREWRFPNNEDGVEEYLALVMVIPEITRGSGWSNEVHINLR